MEDLILIPIYQFRFRLQTKPIYIWRLGKYGFYKVVELDGFVTSDNEDEMTRGFL